MPIAASATSPCSRSGRSSPATSRKDQTIAAAGVRRGTAGARRRRPALVTARRRPVDAFDAKADALALLDALGVPAGRPAGRAGRPGLVPSRPLRHDPARAEERASALSARSIRRSLEALDVKGPLVAFEIILDALPPPKAKPTKIKPKLDAVRLPAGHAATSPSSSTATSRRARWCAPPRRRPQAHRRRRRLRRLRGRGHRSRQEVGRHRGDAAADREDADRCGDRGADSADRRQRRENDRRRAQGLGYDLSRGGGHAMFRWGVLSTAKIAREQLLPAMVDLENGIRSRRSPAATIEGAPSRWHGRFGAEHAFGSYDELLASYDVDGVYIPLPTSQHVEWTLKAANAGKHVLCREADRAGRAGDIAPLIEARDRQQGAGLRSLHGVLPPAMDQGARTEWPGRSDRSGAPRAGGLQLLQCRPRETCATSCISAAARCLTSASIRRWRRDW